jgi:hypothetical protein
MAVIWVGFSRSLGFCELITRYIDPFFSAPPPFADDIGKPAAEVAELVRSFGAPELGPGDFEVYDRVDFPAENFDYGLFARIVPFRTVAPGLKTALANNEARCMFFVIAGRAPVTAVARQPKRVQDNHVAITDVLDAKLDWE